jgi:hypothetical protein
MIRFPVSSFTKLTLLIHEWSGIVTVTVPTSREFLTYETTCINEMAKRTTFEKICQKTPPGNGGTLAQATRPMPAPLAAVAKPGMWPWQRRR